MKINKYKIGNFVAQVKTQTDYENTEPYSLFAYNGDQIDYFVNVEFSPELPHKIEKPDFVSQDRVCLCENGVSLCCYKSRDNDAEYYASRRNEGKKTDIPFIAI